MLISNNHLQNNKRFKFLVVEDELPSQKMIELILHSKFACEISSVGNGEEGVALANNQLFNLILINIGLPGIDGFLVAKTIRQKGTNQHTPIIATSGTIHAKDLYFEAGINAFLIKPFNSTELTEIVKQLIIS